MSEEPGFFSLPGMEGEAPVEAPLRGSGSLEVHASPHKCVDTTAR